MAYDVDDIQKLDYPYSCQRRLSMYLGSQARDENSPGQCNVATREITDNSVTEVVKGYGDFVKIVFNDDGSVTVEDNGRGVPVGKDKETGQTGIEKCFAELHSGGNFSKNANEKSGPGLNGLGGSVVNAVSDMFKVEVFKNGQVYVETFKNGLVEYEMKRHRATEEEIDGFLNTENHKLDFNDVKNITGTRVTFHLNKDFFSSVDNLIVDDIINRMRYTVYVVPNLTIDIIDNTRTSEEGGGYYHFVNDGGIEGMLDFISTGDPIITSTDSEYAKKGIYKISSEAKYTRKVTELVNGETCTKDVVNKIPIEVAFRYDDSENTDVRSFANTIQTFNGGVHETALKDALVNVFGKMVKRNQ